MSEIGETLVAAWYRYIDGLELVVEGVRLRDQGVDVLAVGTGRAVACEVATHILGLDYGGYAKTATKVADKVLRARAFLEATFPTFPEHERLAAFWTPRVPSGLTTLLSAIGGWRSWPTTSTPAAFSSSSSTPVPTRRQRRTLRIGCSKFSPTLGATSCCRGRDDE